MARVPASEATRKRVKQMLTGGSVDHSAMIREAVRLIIEETLEAEVTDAVGRAYNAHGASGRGQRNGYRIGKLDSAEGRVEYAVPQVRGIAGWQSEVKRLLGGRSEELERLALEMYARGLSMRRSQSPALSLCWASAWRAWAHGAKNKRARHSAVAPHQSPPISKSGPQAAFFLR